MSEEMKDIELEEVELEDDELDEAAGGKKEYKYRHKVGKCLACQMMKPMKNNDLFKGPGCYYCMGEGHICNSFDKKLKYTNKEEAKKYYNKKK